MLSDPFSPAEDFHFVIFRTVNHIKLFTRQLVFTFMKAKRAHAFLFAIIFAKKKHKYNNKKTCSYIVTNSVMQWYSLGQRRLW